MSEELMHVDPTNVEWQRDVLGAHCKLAVVLAKLPDRVADAVFHLEQGRNLARALAASSRLAPADAWIVEALEVSFAEIAKSPGATL